MTASRQHGRWPRRCLMLGLALWAGMACGQQYPLQWQYLIDNADTLTAANGQAWDGSGHWQPLQNSEANFGFSRAAYWFRIQLPAALPAAPLLVIDNSHLDRIDVFRLTGGTLSALYRTGDSLPFAQRPWPDRAFAFPLQDLDDADELVVRVSTGGLVRVPVRLLSADTFAVEQRVALVHWAAVLGALGLLAVLHGVAWVATRRRIHVQLVALLTVLALLLAYLSGYAYPLLWPQAPGWQNKAAAVLTALSCTAFSLFALGLPRLLAKPSPRQLVLRWLWVGICISVLTASVLLPPWLGLRLVILFGLIAFAVAVVAGGLLGYAGDRWAKAVAAAWVLLCLALLLLVGEFGAVAPVLWLPQPLPVAAAMVLLSLTVGWREQRLQARLLLRQADAIRRLRLLRDQRARRSATLEPLRQRLQLREQELERLRVVLKNAEEAADGSDASAVLSRRSFDHRYRLEWRRAYRERAVLGLILFEIDGFAGLVASHDEQLGERCLDQVAAAVQGRFRRPADLVARFAPGILAVVAPGAPQPDAFCLAEDVRRRVEATGLEVQGLQRSLTLSAGVASMVPDQRHHEAVLLSFADDALHQARSSGGNRGVCYRPPLPVERET